MAEEASAAYLDVAERKALLGIARRALEGYVREGKVPREAPEGKLAGDRIPLPSRIMAVADTFDAMTSTRAYRDALPVPEANAEIRRCAGTQFDPEIVPLFLACQSRIVVPGDVCMPEGFDEEMLRQLRSHAV